MARPLRIEYPDACYHVINRGNQRAVVFHDDWHYEQFIEKLGYFAAEFRVCVLAYCCMPNHFHLYVRTKEPNLSRFMQSFLTSFGVSSNKKRRTTGHIFQGRFKAHLVDDDLYRSRLSRYIHLNPVRTQAMRAADLEECRNYLRQFKWSSYPGYMGIAKTCKWLDCGPILSCWGKAVLLQKRCLFCGNELRNWLRLVCPQLVHCNCRRVIYGCVAALRRAGEPILAPPHGHNNSGFPCAQRYRT